MDYVEGHRFFPRLRCCNKQVAAVFDRMFSPIGKGTETETGLKIEELHDAETGQNEWRHLECPNAGVTSSCKA